MRLAGDKRRPAIRAGLFARAEVYAAPQQQEPPLSFTYTKLATIVDQAKRVAADLVDRWVLVP